jgi:hypothetical protein
LRSAKSTWKRPARSARADKVDADTLVERLLAAVPQEVTR